MINNSIIQFPIKTNILSQNLKFKFSLFSITIFGKFLELKYYKLFTFLSIDMEILTP